MSSGKAKTILRWMMRAMGVMSILAFAGVAMPASWMDWCHKAIGMGEMPEVPIVGYLSRSLSAFYMFFGAIVLYLSREISRYLDLIGYWGKCGIVFAAITLGIDLSVGLPWWWITSEAGFLIVFFTVVLVLVRVIRKQA